MTVVVVLLVGALILLPILGWIAALLWAARRDGRDEQEFKRTRPPDA